MAGVSEEIQAYVITQINVAMDQRFGSFTTNTGSPYAKLIDDTAAIPQMVAKIGDIEQAVTSLQNELKAMLPDMDAKIRQLNAGFEKG